VPRLAAQITAENAMDVTTPDAPTSIVHKVRNTVWRNRDSLTSIRDPETGLPLWREG